MIPKQLTSLLYKGPCMANKTAKLLNNMSDKVQNWRSSWQPMLNSSPKSPMVEKVHFGIEEQNQGPPWEEERTPHMLQLPSGDDEIYSWIDNSYNIQDISLPEPYNPHSCTSSLAPPLMYPATTTMIGQHVGPSNSAGGFSVASTLTTIPNLDPNNGEPEDDRRKATELLGDYQIETQMENNNPTIKRQRSAEIHNLSERRRRDRINVQMKDLQELIPLSNKLDKASILQGTCEYVKSLKIQLEMFSLMCEIHQTTSIGYPGRFHMPGYYACPTNPFNIPGMLEFNLHSQAHKTAFAGVCKQYLSLYEIEFARGAKPKMHSYTNPRHQAQMASAAQICQHYLSVYQADQSKQIQDQAFPPIFQNKFTRGF